MTTSAIVVLVNGQRLEGWTSAQVFRSVEAAAGSFQLEVTDRANWPIPRGARVDVLVDNEPLMVGWVERLRSRIGELSHSVTIEGRDLTCDLVDCSAELEGGELRGLTLAEIAQTIAGPLGVDVSIDPSADEPEPFELFAVQPGEGAWEVMERACRIRGLLAFPGPTGELLIARPSSVPARRRLYQPGNVKEAEITVDDSQRFSRYVVRSQRPGSDQAFGTAVVGSRGEAIDLGSRSLRVLALHAERSCDDRDCETRAAWESATRAARATSETVVVQGFRDEDLRQLWRVNERLQVDLKGLRLSSELLAISVRFAFDSDGQTCTIGLGRPDSFQPDPTVAREDPADVFGIDLEDALADELGEE